MFPNEEKRRYRVLFDYLHYLPHTLRSVQVWDQLVFYPKDIRPLAVAL
jgi:hypothetical protein